MEVAAGIRRNLPSRDLTRAEGVMQGRATDPIPREGRAVDLPERTPADVTMAESQKLRRSNLQTPLEDVKPLTPEVTMGAKNKRTTRVKGAAKGKRRRKRSRKVKTPLNEDVAVPKTADTAEDILEDVGPLGATPTSSFAKVSDSDLKFLAKRGDKEAIAELKRRYPREGLKSEIGAVGDIESVRFGDRLNRSSKTKDGVRLQYLSKDELLTEVKTGNRDAVDLLAENLPSPIRLRYKTLINKARTGSKKAVNRIIELAKDDGGFVKVGDRKENYLP